MRFCTYNYKLIAIQRKHCSLGYEFIDCGIMSDFYHICSGKLNKFEVQLCMELYMAKLFTDYYKYFVFTGNRAIQRAISNPMRYWVISTPQDQIRDFPIVVERLSWYWYTKERLKRKTFRVLLNSSIFRSFNRERFKWFIGRLL